MSHHDLHVSLQDCVSQLRYVNQEMGHAWSQLQNRQGFLDEGLLYAVYMQQQCHPTPHRFTQDLSIAEQVPFGICWQN